MGRGAKLDATAVAFIRAQPELSNAELARLYGVHRSAVRLVRANMIHKDPAAEPVRSSHRGVSGPR